MGGWVIAMSSCQGDRKVNVLHHPWLPLPPRAGFRVGASSFLLSGVGFRWSG
jgi:hypothetical protein